MLSVIISHLSSCILSLALALLGAEHLTSWNDFILIIYSVMMKHGVDVELIVSNTAPPSLEEDALTAVKSQAQISRFAAARRHQLQDGQAHVSVVEVDDAHWGEYGMKTTANELAPSCDCLGPICDLPSAYIVHDGSVVVIKNVICIHEEDMGLLCKHSDYRIGMLQVYVKGGEEVTIFSITLISSINAQFHQHIFSFHMDPMVDGLRNTSTVI
ncbi:amine oxidase catalytic domain-containing protein [Laetiporus sulphureus 93-53]|uniref:Amine oxidase n=1 Tax=Laetiporus sulphureus 93-53 TaxID=1314785 RepID=A0A165EFL9_9APHY|nr:amine oxidase catalytic domain-containing protein [Laetiporus sulphureus 93-53]KZT06955.1 amine oxidase catalytic domain-containing protein [Laetiporus sulphureus 93-53]